MKLHWLKQCNQCEKLDGRLVQDQMYVCLHFINESVYLPSHCWWLNLFHSGSFEPWSLSELDLQFWAIAVTDMSSTEGAE